MKCLCFRLIRHEHLYSVWGGVTRRLGVPHVQGYRQLPSMALLLLLHNTHFLLGVARQGSPNHFWLSRIVSVVCHFFFSTHSFSVHKCVFFFLCLSYRMSSLRSSLRLLLRLECNSNRCGGQGAAPRRPLQLRYGCHNRTKVISSGRISWLAGLIG